MQVDGPLRNSADPANSSAGESGMYESDASAQGVLEDVLAKLGGAADEAIELRRISLVRRRGCGTDRGETRLKMGLRAPLPPSLRSSLDFCDGAVWCWRLKRSDVARGTADGESSQRPAAAAARNCLNTGRTLASSGR